MKKRITSWGKDAEGKKQGYWERHYSNGKPAYTATFKDDKSYLSTNSVPCFANALIAVGAV